jgi:hypothetical protein
MTFAVVEIEKCGASFLCSAFSCMGKEKLPSFPRISARVQHILLILHIMQQNPLMSRQNFFLPPCKGTKVGINY